MTIRWGIVGTGDISDRVVADLLAVSGCQATAVWGRSHERAAQFAARFGIDVATDQRSELLTRDDVDIVYIATPAHTHAALAIEALNAGKHVLVEKPMATSAADAESIFDTAAAVGRFAMEAMWMRFNPLHIDVRDRILGGALGEVNGVRASFGTPFFPRGAKVSPAQGGSILLDRGIYAVTLAHWFLGDDLRVVESAASYQEGIDIDGRATLATDGGFAQLAWSGVEFLDLSAAISGDRGWVTIDPMFWAGSTARVHAGSAERIFGAPELVEHPRVGNGYGPMIAAVVDAVRAGRIEQPWHTRNDTLAVARTLDAVRAAADPDGARST